MTLAAGSRVGPYEILGTVGAGGMGVVYRARDGRLGRDVAIKVLPDSFASDPGRLSRFELEARAVAALNHPNILGIFDVGTHEGAPYLVMELLDGVTLRERLGGGPIPVRKSIDYAVQIAQGLAAAHEKGLIHRDVKPENLFITRDGRVKVLDFGLAKAVGEVGAAAGTLPQSQSGAVLGTAGYMSPEQVQGKAADARSDIFALGVVLYEMLGGRRAFDGPTPVERGYAILNREPADLAQSGVTVPLGLERIVRRCLEKDREARFQSAHDLGFALSALADASSERAAPLVARRPWWRYGLGALGLVGGLAVGVGVGRTTREPPGPVPQPTYTRVSFNEGLIASARFGPDGQTVYYSASFAGAPWQTWATSIGRPDARPIGPPWHRIVDVSKAGDLLLLRPPEQRGVGGPIASLLTANARTPRDLVQGVGGTFNFMAAPMEPASFGPDGRSFALVRYVGPRSRLEYPAGVTLLETDDDVFGPRVSPTGEGVAIVTNKRGDEYLEVVSSTGARRRLSGPWAAVRGIAWSADGKEVWFSAGRHSRVQMSIWAVTLEGREREVLSGPGLLWLMDRSKDGRTLVVRRDLRGRLVVGERGAPQTTDVSLFDTSRITDLSADGRKMLMLEEGQAAGGGEGGYKLSMRSFLRSVDGTTTVPIADFALACIAPDASWAAGDRGGLAADAGAGLTIVPTGPGVARDLPRGSLDEINGCLWARDGKHITTIGKVAGHDFQVFVQDVEGRGLPVAITGEGVTDTSFQSSPDGRFIVAQYSDGGTTVAALDGSGERSLDGFPRIDEVLDWDLDGGALLVRRRPARPEGLPVEIYRYDIATGEHTPWLTLSPDPAGLDPFGGIFNVFVTPQGTYVYNCLRSLDVVYVIDGLK